MILITPLPGVTTTKPGSATKPFPGVVAAAVVNEHGEKVEQGGGYLVLEALAGDDARDLRRRRPVPLDVLGALPGRVLRGRRRAIDEDGDFWLLGRVDDVMNVSGHRISTIEVESALVDHPRVAEAAVCGRSDATTGQAIVAYVTLKGGDDGLGRDARGAGTTSRTKIGAIAKPANIVFTPELPKTRSGKIMRRLLRDVAEDRPLGDTTTLADPAVCARSPTAPQRPPRTELFQPPRGRERGDRALDVRLGRPPVRDRDADRRPAIPGRAAHPRLAVVLYPPRIASVVASSAKRKSTWLRTTSLSTSQPGAPRPSANAGRGAAAIDQVAHPSRPSARIAGIEARVRAARTWGVQSARDRVPPRRRRSVRTIASRCASGWRSAMPQSYGTLSHLCIVGAHESARSRPATRCAKSGCRAQSPKAPSTWSHAPARLRGVAIASRSSNEPGVHLAGLSAHDRRPSQLGERSASARAHAALAVGGDLDDCARPMPSRRSARSIVTWRFPPTPTRSAVPGSPSSTSQPARASIRAAPRRGRSRAPSGSP